MADPVESLPDRLLAAKRVYEEAEAAARAKVAAQAASIPPPAPPPEEGMATSGLAQRLMSQPAPTGQGWRPDGSPKPVTPPPTPEPSPSPAPDVVLASAFRAGAGLPPKAPPQTGEESSPTPPGPGPSNEDMSPRAAPAQVIPGGMRPYKRSTEVKSGKQIGPDVDAIYGASTEGYLHAASGSAAADQKLLEKSKELMSLQLDANESARLQRAKLNIERDRMVQDRIAHIEDLNRQAQGNPEDLWGERQALAMVLGLFAATLGVATGSGMGAIMGLNAQSVMNKAIDLDMKSKMANRESAGRAVQNEMNLYKLHEESLGNREQAVEATRLAYYQNLMQQLDIYKMQHGIDDNDPRLLKMKSDIMNGYGKTREHLDVLRSEQTEQKFEEKYAPPQVIGGGAVTKEPGNVLTVNGVSYQMPNEKTFNDAVGKIEAYGEAIRINNRIKSLREQTFKLDPIMDHDQYVQNKAVLESLEQDKLKHMETMRKQGVLRESEYPRAQALTGHATTGLGLFKGNPYARSQYAAGNAVLDDQNARWSQDLEHVPKAASAPIVKRGRTINPATGETSITARQTGKITAPSTGVAPRSFQSSFGAKPPTQEESAEDTTPLAPRFDYRAPAPAAGRKKKKE